MPSRLQPGKRRFAVLAALAAFAVIGMAGLYILGFLAVERDARLLAEVRRELVQREEFRQDIAGATRALDDLAREYLLVSSSFSDPEDPLPFVEEIERLADRFGVQSEIRLAGGEEQSDAYDAIITGPFRGALSFLERIESLPYLADIEAVDLESDGISARLTIGLRLVPFPDSS